MEMIPKGSSLKTALCFPPSLLTGAFEIVISERKCLRIRDICIHYIKEICLMKMTLKSSLLKICTWNK